MRTRLNSDDCTLSFKDESVSWFDNSRSMRIQIVGLRRNFHKRQVIL